MILSILFFILKVIALAFAVEIAEFCFYSFIRNVWQPALLTTKPDNWLLAFTETFVICIMLYLGCSAFVTFAVAFCVLILRKEAFRLFQRN